VAAKRTAEVVSLLRAGDVRTLLTRYSDMALAGLVVAIVGMMIVPLPTPVLDLLISVNIADDGTLRFSQRRYSPSRPDDETKWAVPLLVRQTTPDGRETTDAILVEAEGATLPMASPDAVVVANAGGISFVRVWYDEVLAARLAGSAMRALSPLERYALVDDAWAAVVDGSTTASSFCRFVEGFADETELPVWQLMLTGLNWCDRFIEGEPRDRFRSPVAAMTPERPMPPAAAPPA